MKNLTIEYLESLKYSWTAVIEQHNGVQVPIWYTALPSAKQRIKRIITAYSDYPKNEIGKEKFSLVF